MGGRHGAVVKLGQLGAGHELDVGDGAQGAAAAPVRVKELVALPHCFGHIGPYPTGQDLVGDGLVRRVGAGDGHLGVLGVQGKAHHRHHYDDQQVDDADEAEQAAVAVDDLFHPCSPLSMETTGPLPI